MHDRPPDPSPALPEPARSRGETVLCEVRALAAGGDGVASLPDGRTLFVPFTAPGDRVEVEVLESHPRWARAALRRVIDPAPVRVPPRCAVFGRCGGCAWQHLDYTEQLRAKARILRDALERIGGIALAELPEMTASPSPYAYRGRARLLSRGRKVGYRARASHELCPVERCPVLLPELEVELQRLAARLAEGDGVPSPGDVGEWELATGREGQVRCALLSPQRDEAAAPVELAVSGERIRVSPGVFAQANALLLEALATAVVAEARAYAPATRRLLELHAGAGFFTLGLAAHFSEGVAVEGDRRAVSDLRHNLAAAGHSHVRVLRERAGRLLARWAARRAEQAPFDCAVLDPPRSGLERGAAQHLVELGPVCLVYLSCDPATLARDARVLAAGGYRLRSLRGFDLFPQTPHVEALSVWQRD